MREWAELYRRQVRMRDDGVFLSNEIRARLIRLAAAGHCDGTIQGRFTQRKNGGLREWFISPRNGPSGGPEPLDRLPDLESARLTVLLLSDARTFRVHQFTAMLEGTPPGGGGWVVAVHLEDERNPNDRKGDGGCGHAAFHCHIGPTMDAVPKVRVPLPDVGPVGALDWMLTLVVPNWEPAPWPRVLEALEPRE